MWSWASFFLINVLILQDKQALEQQQLSNRLQISALQSKLDETRHCYLDNARDPTQELRDALDAAQQSLNSKEQEVCRILERVSVRRIRSGGCLKHLAALTLILTNVNDYSNLIHLFKVNTSDRNLWQLIFLTHHRKKWCNNINFLDLVINVMSLGWSPARPAGQRAEGLEHQRGRTETPHTAAGSSDQSECSSC